MGAPGMGQLGGGSPATGASGANQDGGSGEVSRGSGRIDTCWHRPQAAATRAAHPARPGKWP